MKTRGKSKTRESSENDDKEMEGKKTNTKLRRTEIMRRYRAKLKTKPEQIEAARAQTETESN